MQQATSNKPDFLWRNLFRLPYFRGLLRAVEATYYQDLRLAAHVLDVGCGDGIFAELTFEQKIDVGIDPWLQPLREAVASNMYKMLVHGAGDRLPFPDAYFQTVISNSVLEHIPDLQPVLAEISRVIKPGGQFIFCVPNDNFLKNLGVSNTLDKLGWHSAADGYRAFFNKISRHHHCDNQDTWRAWLDAHDFEIVSAWNYFTPQATRTLEFGHYLGLPALVSKVLFGRWILAPTQWNLSLTRKITAPYYESDQKQPGGSYSFYVARRR